MTDEQLYRAVASGEPHDRFMEAIEELESNGALSRDESGYLFSRRMVREEQMRETKAKAGAKGAEKRWQNDGKSKNPAIDLPSDESIANNGSSSSLSSSTSVKKEKTNKKKKPVSVEDLEIPQSLDTPECRSAIADWLAYKRERRDAYKRASYMNGLLKEFSQDGASVFCEAVKFSMNQNYKGLFRPKGNHANSTDPFSEIDKSIALAEQREREQAERYPQDITPTLRGLPGSPRQ